jgi:hypothetical protein
VWFSSSAAAASNNECLQAFGDGHAGCSAPNAVGFYAKNDAVVVPLGGGTIADLEVRVDAAAAGSGNTVTILKNGSAALSCTVTAGNTSCSNSGLATLAAGDFLQVQVTNNAGAANRKYQVSFQI